MKRFFCLFMVACLCFCMDGCAVIDDPGFSEECDHVYSDATCTSPEECVKCGKTFGLPKGHSYLEATCTEPAVCSVCGATDGSPKGHSFVNATCTARGTCSVCGEKSNALGHSMSEATCTSPQKCSRCGMTSGKALGHSDNGKGKCSRCGKTLSVDMQKRVGSPNDCAQVQNLGGFSFYQNSADGIKVLWGGKNNSGKTVNYYTITFHFYNPVGDEACSKITGKATKSYKVVGPVAPGEDLLVLSIVDYVPTCTKVQIDQIKLEYSDGTVEYGWYGWYTTYQNKFLK